MISKIHIGRILVNGINSEQEITPPKYIIYNKTIVQTCICPEIWECEDINGIIIYIKKSDNGDLTIREKRTGEIIGIGTPVLHKDESIPIHTLEFYMEMYSQFKIKIENV